MSRKGWWSDSSLTDRAARRPSPESGGLLALRGGSDRLLLLRKEVEDDQEEGSKLPSCVCRWIEKSLWEGEAACVRRKKERESVCTKITVVEDGKVRGLWFGPVRIVIAKKKKKRQMKVETLNTIRFVKEGKGRKEQGKGMVLNVVQGQKENWWVKWCVVIFVTKEKKR